VLLYWVIQVFTSVRDIDWQEGLPLESWCWKSTETRLTKILNFCEIMSVAYFGFQKGGGRGGGVRGRSPKNHFYVPKIIIFGAFWRRFFYLLYVQQQGAKPIFLCHTCECLKMITQPITIQWIKPQISGNISFLKIFQLCTYTNIMEL